MAAKQSVEDDLIAKKKSVLQQFLKSFGAYVDIELKTVRKFKWVILKLKNTHVEVSTVLIST